MVRQRLNRPIPARTAGVLPVAVTVLFLAAIGAGIAWSVLQSLGTAADAFHGAVEMVDPVRGRTLALAPDRGA